jgi:hypothetical protein
MTQRASTRHASARHLLLNAACFLQRALRGDNLSDRLVINMPVNDADAHLSQQMDLLVKTWGLRADCSGETLSNNDVLHRCSIGDVATISKLKPRPMQAFIDSTSALGLRIVGMLSALLQQQVKARRVVALEYPHSRASLQLPFSSEASISAALLKSQSGDAALDASSFVSVGLWHRVRKLNSRLHKRHGATPASLHAADAAASPSSSDTGSSDSEVEGVPTLMPFKADTARTASGTLVVSAPSPSCRNSSLNFWPLLTLVQSDAHAAFVIDAFASDIQAIFASETADAKAASRLVDAIRNCAGLSSALQYGAAAATTLNFKRRKASAASRVDDATAVAKKSRHVKA